MLMVFSIQRIKMGGVCGMLVEKHFLTFVPCGLIYILVVLVGIGDMWIKVALALWPGIVG
jgi:hypothetical protein